MYRVDGSYSGYMFYFLILSGLAYSENVNNDKTIVFFLYIFSADTDVNIRHADIMVSHHGAVFWSPHRVFTSACLIDVTNFPYDTHRCDMWFQAMSRYTTQMDLIPFGRSPWDMTTYLESFRQSQRWVILNNTTQRFNASRAAGVELKFSKRVSLRFSVTITRRSGYTGVLLMVPCVLLGCTTVVIFCLPPERPDRITLGKHGYGFPVFE